MCHGREQHNEWSEVAKGIGIGDKADGAEPLHQKIHPWVVALICDALKLGLEGEVADDVKRDKPHPLADIYDTFHLNPFLKQMDEVIDVRCQSGLLVTDSA